MSFARSALVALFAVASLVPGRIASAQPQAPADASPADDTRPPGDAAEQDGDSAAVAADRGVDDVTAPDLEGPDASDAATSQAHDENADDEDASGRILATRQPIGRFPDDSVVRAGEFERSFTIPGTDLSLRVGGLVRLEIAFDPDSLGPMAVVSPIGIPLDGSPADGTQQLELSARDSRINFEIRHDDDHRVFRTFIEADFFGDGNDLINGYGFRLRHAIAQFGPFVAGQWWSAFVDTRTFPENSSFGGPVGAPTARQPSVRLTDTIGEEARWRWVVSVENPVADFNDPGSLALAAERVPDVVVATAMTYPLLRLQVALLGRLLESESDRALAGGVNVSGRLQLPFLSSHGDNLAFQGQIGTGIGRYYVGVAGAGVDGVVNDDGSVDPMVTFGGFVAYQHWWTDRIRSTITASYQRFDPPNGAVFLPLREAGFYAINLFFTPTEGATFGIDVIYATRRTSQGELGAGVRTHASARFDF